MQTVFKMMLRRYSHFCSIFLAAIFCVLPFKRALFPQTGPLVELVKDINRGREGSDPENFVTLNGWAYFRANDGRRGFELWRSNGTKDGTQLVVDLNPGPFSGFPDNITVVNGGLYFTAFNNIRYQGSKVWRSDGTKAGTMLLADTYPELRNGGPFGLPLPAQFTALSAHTVLFTALDREGGLEPWRSDGTPSGTTRIIDLHPGQEWSIPIEFTPLRNVAYFAADDSAIYYPDGTATYNRELFRTDGTSAGTYRVKDIYPGPLPSTPTDFIRFRQRVFFRAQDRTHGTELWSTDGTTAGTTLVSDLNPGSGGSNPQYPIQTRFAGSDETTLVFLAEDGIHGQELFRSDGASAGTWLIKDINPNGDSVPLGLTPYKGRVYFSADDGQHGAEIWVTDGTEGGTRLFADLNRGKLRSSPQSFTVAGGWLFFVAILPNDAQYTVRTQLWVTDGTAAGTRMIYQEPGVSYGYAINNLTALGSKLLFTAPYAVDAEGFSTDTELFAVSLN
jgi:ELWxxDGT repeat protein